MTADRLPNDLLGGWSHLNSFRPVPLEKGQVWRKIGPVDALKVIRVMMPGHSENDGGAQGISVRPTTIGSSGKIRWSNKTWFRMGTEKQIHNFLKEHGYSLANSGDCHVDQD